MRMTLPRRPFVRRRSVLAAGVLALWMAAAWHVRAAENRDIWAVFYASQTDERPVGRTRVKANDELRTGAADRIDLFLGDQTRVRLGSQTAVRVRRASVERPEITLTSGRVAAGSDREAPLSVAVGSHTVTLQGEKGFRALLAHDAGAADVWMDQGSARVQEAGGDQTVAAGQGRRWGPAGTETLTQAPAQTPSLLAGDRVSEAFRSAMKAEEQIPVQDWRRDLERAPRARSDRTAADLNSSPEEELGRPSGESYPKNDEDIRP